MLTPMAKLYCSEMCIRVAHNGIQVLGGSGYMKDYAAERYLRDARITTIYEGTSQLQVVAAVRGVSSGAFETWTSDHDTLDHGDAELNALRDELVEAKARMMETIAFIKKQGPGYMDLSGRRLVDSAMDVIIGHLLLGQAEKNERKRLVARRFIRRQLPTLHVNCEQILTGDTTALDQYAELAGPVPAAD
jgi:hypothetical protein